jgi:hypothetical protein
MHPSIVQDSGTRSSVPNGEVQVVFIGGASRTGSTVLSLLLGAIPGYFAAGEMRYLWLRGLQGDQLCGCGAPFRSCPFWREVLDKALGPVDEIPAEEYAALWSRTARPLQVLRDIVPASSERRSRRREYLDALGRVFRAVHEVSGGRIIVDSSKYATDCLLLSRLPGVRVHAIHLVRDSRAVAYSWQRTKRRPEIHWRQQDMSRFSPFRSSFDWGAMNLAMEAVRGRVERYDRLAYEDFACDPVGTLRPLFPTLDHGELEDVVSGGDGGAGVHTVSGNPLRFERGPLAIHPDVEWVANIGVRDRRVVTGLTWPLLLRYGYGLRPWEESRSG